MKLQLSMWEREGVWGVIGGEGERGAERESEKEEERTSPKATVECI